VVGGLDCCGSGWGFWECGNQIWGIWILASYRLLRGVRRSGQLDPWSWDR
jgi:hypothetical protein